MVVNRRKPVTIYEVYDDDPEPLRAAKRSAQPAFDEAFAFSTPVMSTVHAPPSSMPRITARRSRRAIAPGALDAMARGEMTPGQDVALLQK